MSLFTKHRATTRQHNHFLHSPSSFLVHRVVELVSIHTQQIPSFLPTHISFNLGSRAGLGWQKRSKSKLFYMKSFSILSILIALPLLLTSLARLSNASPIVESSLGPRSGLLEKAKGCLSSFCDRPRTNICLFYLNDEIAMKYYKTKHSFNVERDGLSLRLAPFKLPELNCTFGLESELREIAQKGDWECIIDANEDKFEELNKVYTYRPSEAGPSAMTFAMAAWIQVFIPHALFSRRDLDLKVRCQSLGQDMDFRIPRWRSWKIKNWPRDSSGELLPLNHIGPWHPTPQI
ncbi:hypothetical protein C8J55DRAFT_519646 [Lentinula edodes]|uniref:Uncharacterized protein n=1 Tax=Lentinula lateritia TaxID=40482 RepID=A0A9W9A2Z1_9AGAR|nr:hypothetical protein C8J55DRAFT_519646 [Lentinula edodes]